MRTIYTRLAPAGRALAVLLMLAGCQQSPAANVGLAAPEVEVAQVVSRELRIADEFTGRVEAIQSVEVRPRVRGHVDRISYTEGAEVTAGQLLFVIDPRPYQDALTSARARLDAARAALKVARSTYDRSEKLVAVQVISRQDFEANGHILEQALAQLHVSEAEVATAQLNLGFTSVRSPIAGRAGRALLTPGNLARDDESLLTTVVSQDAVHVYFDCDESSFARYREGAARTKPTVRIGLGSEEGFPHLGNVDFLDNRIDAATGTIRARAVVANPDRKFTPGMFARVHLESGAPAQALLVDDKAILTDQDRRFVYVVDSQNKSLRKDVTLGRKVGDMRIVQTGLRKDDRVITSGFQKVYVSGMRVTPVAKPVSGMSTAPATSTN